MFEKLMQAVGDNAEAKTEISAIQSQVSQKDATIQSLQSQFDEVKKEKDNYKKGNQLLKSALGLEQVNEETVAAKIAELTSNSKTAKDIHELTQALSGKDDEINRIKSEYETRFTTMKVDAELAKALDGNSDVLVDDPILRGAFKDIIAKSVGVVGDAISPFTVVGDQRVPIVNDGKTLDVTGYVKSVLSTDTYASFRKAHTQPSAGKLGQGGGQQGGDVSKMTPAEKFKHYEQKAIGA
jgi:uncharacterized protein YhaN